MTKQEKIIHWISKQPPRRSRIFEAEYLSEYRRKNNQELMFTGEEMSLKIKKGSEVSPVVFRTTGSAELDDIFKFPANRVGIVYGPPGGGKSSSLMEHVAAMQQIDQDFKALLIAAESMDGIADGYYKDVIGVDMDRMDVVETKDVPPMEELMNALLGKNVMAAANKAKGLEPRLKRYEGALLKEYDLVIIDSVDAIRARQVFLDSKNKTRGIDNDNPGVNARKWSEGLPQICAAVDALNSAVYGICQTRANIGGYGALHQVTGGQAWKYYSSFRLAIKRGKVIEEGTNENKRTLGYYRNVLIEKTKISGNELKSVDCPYIFGEGLDTTIGLFNACLGPIISCAGAWHYCDLFPELSSGKRGIQGRANAIQFFKSSPEATQQLQAMLDEYQHLQTTTIVDVRTENPDTDELPV